MRSDTINNIDNANNAAELDFLLRRQLHRISLFNLFAQRFEGGSV
jgi:hypothetical protein